MKQRVQQTSNLPGLPIHKSKKFTIIYGLKEFWCRGKFLNLPAVATHIRFFTRGEKQISSSFQEGKKCCSPVILKVIEAAAGPTGLCVVWLTQMMRIVSHRVTT